MTPDLILLTPTYRADLERFRLLRASLEGAGCGLRHLAVVQTEDLEAFRRERFGPSVELLASADVLPAEVESGRRGNLARPPGLRKLRRSLNKRLGWFPDATFDGWHAQQVVKLAVPALGLARAVVTLDSDVVACAPFDGGAFLAGGRVALPSQPRSGPSGLAHWDRAAAGLLRLDPAALEELNYVAHPFVFDRDTTAALHRRLEEIHGAEWWRPLLALPAGSLSEFTVYGTFARAVRKMEGLFDIPANGSTRWVFTGEDRANTAAIIRESFASPSVRYLCINAHRNHPITPYEPLLAECIAGMAGSPGRGATAPVAR